ncbi:MAG: MMPL family transporter [Deltaproteobacteria bacterium]|nr:MMPL family transporter [Deltaproteobacteria bacterium]
MLDQLVTGDNSEALIQAKLGTVNTKQILALVNTVDNYINQELRTNLVTLQITPALPEFADELAKERTERILSRIDWDIRKRGIECDACITQIEEKVFAAVSTSNNKYDDALIDSIAMNVSNNLRGESADIPIESEKIINAVVSDIGDALRHDKSSKENIFNILKNDIPHALYSDDPDGLDYAAETITAIIKDEKEWSKVNRLIQEIKPFLPVSLANDEEFLGDIRDTVWEINEDWTAIAGSKYASLSGRGNIENLTKLSVQQTGMPIIYTDLDRKIIRSQASSLSIAILLVFIFLTYRLKSLVGGLISITPILLAILINFTIMAIFGIPLDVVTVLIGSVAVGIGIDYTIHFITRFKVEHAKGKTELEALDKTLETTGKAIVINALSVTMGFLALVLGNIVPMQRFGYLIALTMIISAMASITVLPALILVTRAGFIGNFEKSISKTINHKIVRGGNQNGVV